MNSASDYSAKDLLSAARQLIATPKMASGVWPRAAAHLCRQALELGLEEFWAGRQPELRGLPLRMQLVCLPLYLSDRDVAHSIGYTWAALSRACHHQFYELAPTVSELASWTDSIDAMLQHTAQRH